MNSNHIHPPRKFRVGQEKQIEISHCLNLQLNPDEQVTLLTDSKKEFDLVRKSWGFYATPSVNSRLKKQGFKTALVKNLNNRHYVMLVENDQMDSFHEYLQEEQSEIVQWLDELPKE